MTDRKVFCWTALALVAPAVCLAQGPAPAAGAEAAGEAMVKKMTGLMRRPTASSQEEFKTKIRAQMNELLALLGQMEAKHAKAKGIHEARMMGVVAAASLARLDNSAALAARARAIAGKIAASEAPPKLKFYADAHTMVLTLNPPGASPASRPAKPDPKIVRDFVARHAKGDVAPEALATGMAMASGIGEADLAKEYQDTLLKKYPESPLAQRLLRQQGKGPGVGKSFSADLTKLDGAKLKLPDDLLGKVVVVDFWATWCAPCIREVPHMKELYAKYKPKGVEFVGISLDRDKAKLTEFVKAQGMTWIHTYTGAGWRDPTVGKYGVRGIPSIWVVGKDGKVVSDNARGRLGSTIEQALKAPAPKKGN